MLSFELRKSRNFDSDLAPVSRSLSWGRQDAYPTRKISILWDGRPARPENGIATARAVMTPGAGHALSHPVDNQTGRVACEFDF